MPNLPDARKVFCVNLKKYMRAKGISQTQIVNQLKVTASTVSDWVNGKKYPRIEAMQQLAAFLGCSVSVLTASEKQAVSYQYAMPIPSNRVPLVGNIQCGAPTYAEEELEGYVEVGTGVRADFALRAHGDSMSGIGILDGYIVFIRKQAAVNDGEVAAVILDDDATLKRVRYLPGGMTMLQAENPKYKPIVIGGADETRAVQVLGKAVAFLGEIR